MKSRFIAPQSKWQKRLISLWEEKHPNIPLQQMGFPANWKENHDALNRMRREIDDAFFEAAQKYGLAFPLELQDKLIDRCIEIAIANEKN